MNLQKKVDRRPGLSKKCRRKRHYLSIFLLLFLTALFSADGYARFTPNSVNELQQKQKVEGKITDKTGTPINGASISIKGTKVGTLSDREGAFSLEVADLSAILTVSYAGYKTQEIALNGQSTLSVTLEEEVNELEDVVMVGYGTQKKSDLTGAIVSISAEQIAQRPVTNALQAIQGKAAGVDITSNERPGQMGSVLIRGSRSLTASNSPLYVVDGIPLAAGGIDGINPLDIETIDILKDASATAIYGSRGANGVILVTTKQGKAGKMTLNYSGTMTIENQQDRSEMMNSPEYIEFRRAAYRRAGQYPDVPTEEADKKIFGGDNYAWANVQKGWANGSWNGSLVPTTDWGDMVLRTGVTQEHQLSASGGSDKIKTYASVGYLSQKGTQKGQDYTRYSGKFSIDLKPLSWFRFGGSLSTTYSIQNYGYASSSPSGAGDLYSAARGMLPFAVPFDSLGQRINLPGGDINILNPIGEDKYNINERKVLRTLGQVYAEVNILPGLKFRTNFGPDFYNFRNGRWMDSLSINRGGGEPGSTNSAELNQSSKFSWTLDNLIYYDKTIAKDHNIHVTLLQSSSSDRTEVSDMRATDLPWNSQLWYQLNSVDALDGFSSGLTEQSLESYMARVNYDYRGKYLLTVSSRWDGASQLAAGHKWSYFPSAAVAWRLDQESFLKNVSWIRQLKLRAGLGTTGNAAITPYQTKGGVQTLYYTWGSLVDAGYVSSDASLASPNPLANPYLGWERTTQFNLGVDFDLFQGRIGGSIDVYKSTTNDLLMQASIPSVTGYTTTFANIGQTGNKGIDISLNTVNIQSRDFTWTTNATFSLNKDRINELSNGKQDDINNNWFIGRSISVYYDYKKLGIWQNTDADLAEIAKFNANGSKFKPGDIRVADLNGDYKIDANNDREIVGQNNPDWIAGLQNTFTYKNWELNVFIFSRLGFTTETGNEPMQGRYAQRLLDYWTPENPTNAYPSPNYNSAAGDPYKSTLNYQNGSFIKIRNISLGYHLPRKFADKLQISDLKIYAQLTNPGLIYSGVSWIDPDLGRSTYNRGFVIGANLAF
ncbi:MAG TPA: TonB-dependent receptor [Arachidicoccus sp.]|nr:TonB-dependent receptor [Arachidicoccus sp.]